MSTGRRQALSNLAFERGGLLTLAVLALYLWLAPTFIVDGDNAEFSTLGVTGGVAHPPGYPLYVLYLRAMSWLPAASGAHRAALATALLGGASIFVLHAACRAWGARSGAASLAVAIVAGAPVVLRLHTAAEVFALNDLVVATVLWLAAAAGPLRGGKRVVALALVAGLGLSNHHTCGLLAPVGLLGIVRGVRETQARVRAIALGVVALVVGLTPYLYLFVAARSAVSWGHPQSFSDLLAHFTRRDYGGIGSFSPVPGEIHVGANLLALVTTIGRAWLWAPAGLAIAMLGVRAVRRGDGEPRMGWAMLALTFVIAGPLLIARFNVPPTGIGLYICHRFHLLPVLLLAVPAAIGFERLARALDARLSRRRPVVRELLCVAVFASAAGLSLPHILATHSPAVEKGVVNILQSLPDNAVLLGTADDLHFGAAYVQSVRGIRPDIAVVTFAMTPMSWYRERFARRGLAIDPHGPEEGQPSIRIAKQVFATGRPLFVEISLQTILDTFDSYPYGVMLRILPPGTPKPNLDEIVDLNRDIYARFDLAYPRPAEGAEYAAAMHLRYARTWDILARAFKDAGRPEDARAARDVVHQLMPLP